MSLISNFKIEEDFLTFDINNNTEKNIKISLVNALRRTIISYINAYAIDPKKIVFFDLYEDDSILNQEFLIDRLALIPIISNLNIDYENLTISCKKENQEENMENVYVNDFICKNSLTDEVIENNILFKYPNILFSKLRNGQKITFEAKLDKNNAFHKGSAYSTVAGCVYTFKIDQQKVKEITDEMSERDKNEFLTQENERHYEKNNIGEPSIYEFKFESIGFYDCKTILKMGIEILSNQLSFLKDEFDNLNSNKIIYLDEDISDDFFKFLIDDENETIGNLLTTYLSSYDNVFYSGYLIEHPLKKNIILKIKLTENNNKENSILTIKNIIDYILNILNIMLEELK
jgi:DNA-directed RNA polymerase subunit L